jgi:predicted O-methyltransferase YrrM
MTKQSKVSKRAYTKKVIQERIKKLLQTPRVYWTPLANENKVDGLVDLVKKYITNKDFVVEVGSFSGVSSQVLALHCKELHCVDPYSWDAVKEAEKMFDTMLEDYPNIKKVKKPSIEGARDYEDHSIDLVYIDGDHS